MIFIVLGSQKFQFNRLLKYIDELIAENKIMGTVIAQCGHSDYTPQNYEGVPFYNQDEFKRIVSAADIIITHAGTGAIITALKNNKKVIAMPRLKEYAEHVDNHQIQIVKNFVKKNYILEAHDKDSLFEGISNIKNHQFAKFKSNNSAYINTIKDFLTNE